MSYKVGQYRSSSSNFNNLESSYLTKVAMEMGDRLTEASSIQRIYFKDKKFSIKNSFFERGVNYYIKIKIERPEVEASENIKNRNSNQQFLLFLENESESDKSSQFLKSFYVPSVQKNAREQQKYVTLELIFTPSLNYFNLVLQMRRTGIDYLDETIENNSSYYGRVVIIPEGGYECYLIKNILNDIAQENQATSSIEFLKIGIQGPPGMLMCINGQEIRVWPNGIYEIKNGYKISFLGFIVPENSSFILDYQY